MLLKVKTHVLRRRATAIERPDRVGEAIHDLEYALVASLSKKCDDLVEYEPKCVDSFFGE